MKRIRQWYSVVTVINAPGGMEIVATDYCGSQPKAMDILRDHSYNLPPKKGFSSMVVPLSEKPEVVRCQRFKRGSWDHDFYRRVA